MDKEAVGVVLPGSKPRLAVLRMMSPLPLKQAAYTRIAASA